MADPAGFTRTADVDFDQDAWDRLAYFDFRPELYFDPVADVKPTRQSMPGKTVKFTKVADLAVASTALDESVDIDAVALSDSQVTVTLDEYGNAVVTTAKLRGTSFLEVDPVVANVIGFNAGVSIDTIARDVLKAGTNVAYSGSATDRDEVTPTDTLDASDVIEQVAELRTDNVPTVGGSYLGFIHPHVSADFRQKADTSNATWRDPHTYSDPSAIYNGEIGKFEGVRWIETPRAPIFADAGSSTTLTDVYRTIIAGRQSLAVAHSYTDGNGRFPKVVPGPITDKLRRFVPLGWYWLGGYAIFREESLRAIESGSSLGANA